MEVSRAFKALPLSFGDLSNRSVRDRKIGSASSANGIVRSAVYDVRRASVISPINGTGKEAEFDKAVHGDCLVAKAFTSRRERGEFHQLSICYRTKSSRKFDLILRTEQSFKELARKIDEQCVVFPLRDQRTSVTKLIGFSERSVIVLTLQETPCDLPRVGHQVIVVALHVERSQAVVRGACKRDVVLADLDVFDRRP